MAFLVIFWRFSFFFSEESIGDSSSSYRKRQKKRRRTSTVCSSSNSRSSRSQLQKKEEELAIYHIDAIDVENTAVKPNILQKAWSYVKKYAAIFQMVLALILLCFPGNLVTVYLQIQSPNGSNRLRGKYPLSDG